MLKKINYFKCFFVLSVLMLSLLFSNCDYFYSIRGEIINYSNDTLIVVVDGDANEIPPNTSFNDLFAGYEERNPKKNFDCCPCKFDYIEIKPKNNNRHIVKNYKDKSLWDLNKSQLKKGKIMFCKIVFNPEDIN